LEYCHRCPWASRHKKYSLSSPLVFISENMERERTRDYYTSILATRWFVLRTSLSNFAYPSPSGQVLAVGTSSGKILLYSVESGQLLHTLPITTSDTLPYASPPPSVVKQAQQWHSAPIVHIGWVEQSESAHTHRNYHYSSNRKLPTLPPYVKENEAPNPSAGASFISVNPTKLSIMVSTDESGKIILSYAILAFALSPLTEGPNLQVTWIASNR